MDTTTLVILLVIVILIAWMVTLYNRLVSLKANRENAFSDIDVQLKLRFDLVPNIVNTVK
jgi:LemA protein